MELSRHVLRRTDANRNMDRFYELTLEPTLFGQWAVVRRWGRFQSNGRTREDWFDAPAPALAFIGQLHSQKVKRGYQDFGAAGC